MECCLTIHITVFNTKIFEFYYCLDFKGTVDNI